MSLWGRVAGHVAPTLVARTSSHIRFQRYGEASNGAGSNYVVLARGLLIGSSKTFDDTQAEVTQLAANVVLLDRVLAHYGPETAEARAMLRDAVAPSDRQSITPSVESDTGPAAFVTISRPRLTRDGANSGRFPRMQL